MRDAGRSAAWYKMLGFERAGEYRAPGGSSCRTVFMRHEGLNLCLGQSGHQRGPVPASDETATELDHLAFGCLPWAELSDRE